MGIKPTTNYMVRATCTSGLLHNRRFDIAMVAFLDCLKHLMDYIKLQDASVDFPHQFVEIIWFKSVARLIARLESRKTKSAMCPLNFSSIRKKHGLAPFGMSFWHSKYVSSGPRMGRMAECRPLRVDCAGFL